MPLDLELCLIERARDRVRVSLALTPQNPEGEVVDEALVQLVDATGEELCPRLLLPIAGRLIGHVQTTFELRATSISDGARVLASVWQDGDPVQVSIPADPFIRLLDYLQGSRIASPSADDVLLSPLSEEEEGRLEKVFPWVRQPLRVAEVAVIEATSTSAADDLAETFGLDEENAAWLEELLEDP